jgi:hypothetical protein
VEKFGVSRSFSREDPAESSICLAECRLRANCSLTVRHVDERRMHCDVALAVAAVATAAYDRGLATKPRPADLAATAADAMYTQGMSERSQPVTGGQGAARPPAATIGKCDSRRDSSDDGADRERNGRPPEDADEPTRRG